MNDVEKIKTFIPIMNGIVLRFVWQSGTVRRIFRTYEILRTGQKYTISKIIILF